ncbi:MAG: 3D-(3,5/4)-trihydroxycyclohexane-1,2-dione acylhydrolase (decyclizing) [Elusimicrobia bacterium]|nr:3D-(3,5/4)-trihydroxycyclohexane-1,2-dione acylhydrolase (decyclizing) [Elusimicrobiota bacterium]
MKTRRLTAAGAIVEFLKAQYISRDGNERRFIRGVFAIFGHGNVAGLGQALEEYGGKELPCFQAKNEQAMVHTAAAFAKAKRRMEILACTTSVGPGATNMITGAAAATVNRLPVLLLPGDFFAGRIPEPVLQRLEHPLSMDTSVNDCFRPVSRYWDRIQRPEQLLRALPEAIRVLADPAQTGAVTICLPEDVQAEQYDFPANFFAKKVYAVTRRRCPAQDIAQAAALIKKSARPFIVAGGGVHYSEAEKALENLAGGTRLPVGVTQAGKGALLDSHPCCLGAVGTTGSFAADKIAKDADLVIVIGSRLSDFTTASKTQFQNEKVRFIGLNVDPFDAHKHGAFPLVGDARAVLEDLGKALKGYRVSAAYQAEISAAARKWETLYGKIVRPKKKPGEKLRQSEVIRILNDYAGSNATVVHAAGGIPGDIHKLWKSKDARDYHSEYGYSCMGYEIAGALGVKLACPGREVYALLGDGSYLMLNQEIVTSVQEGLKITVVMADNHGYQCIHNLQKSCGGKSFCNEFRFRNGGTMRLEGETLPVDFLANAESLGAAGFYAATEKDLIQALDNARREKGTCFIYVPVKPHTPLPGFSWWDVPVAAVSQCPSVKKARARYLKIKEKQRFYY